MATVSKVGAGEYGGMIGFCNTVFIATAIGIYWNAGFLMAFVVFLIGVMPGLVTGAMLGILAAALAERPVWLRRLAIAGPAVAVLLGLAAVFDVTHVFLLAVIPTLVSALVLERHTRARALVPVAILK